MAMDNRIMLLQEWGCDTAAALERMLDDEDFYIECLQIVQTDVHFDKLKIALENRETETAFDCAHTLKGVLGNVGLTPMYEMDVQIVEQLRIGRCENLDDKLESLLRMRERLGDILAG
jgi:HPt (histidine-containing phosphotransfer) domain-containing protein